MIGKRGAVEYKYAETKRKNLYGSAFQTQLNTNAKEESLSLKGKLIFQILNTNVGSL